MIHIFEFDFSDSFIEYSVRFFDLGVPLFKQSMFPASFGEWIVIFGYFVGIELFFGLGDGYVVLLDDGGE